jgi:methionine-rich copper-binding protein CopC
MKLRHTALALCTMTCIVGASPAFAHAYLKKSDPAAGSVLKAAPKTLLLTYTEDLDVAFCSVTVTDGMGMNDAAGKPQAVPGHPNELQVPLNIQMPGKITVAWHALSTDTHKTQGSFSFTVAQLQG